MTNAKLAFGSVAACLSVIAVGSALWLRYPLDSIRGALPFGIVLVVLLIVVLGVRARTRLRLGISALLLLGSGVGLALLVSDNVSDMIYGLAGFNYAKISHPPFQYRVAANAPGYDARGWRNVQALDRAEIVVLGDSQTWGINALIHETWTAQLGTLSGQAVYNMALPGYGMAEYALLLDDALTLQPESILLGVYTGNDLTDAYLAVYERGAFPDLRNPTFVHDLDTANWERDSLTFTASGLPTTIMTPAYRLNVLDLNRPYVAEGLRLTTVLLQATADACAAAGVRCVVVLIPTKETVYNLPLAGDYTTLLANEAQVNAQLAETCARVGLQFVDTTPALQAALAAGERLYPVVNDGHPLPAGYRVIAEVVAAALRFY